MHPLDISFGQRLRRLRQAAGFSQAELAERLGRPQASVSRLESGARSCQLPELYALAALLRLSVSELLSEELPAAQRAALIDVEPVSLETALSFLAAHGVRFLGKTVKPAVLKPSLAAAILAALQHAQEPRLFEALPGLIKEGEKTLDWDSLIQASVSRRLQNRLGAVVAASFNREASPIFKAVLDKLLPWKLDRQEFLGPAPRTAEGREMLAHRTPAWLKAWHLFGAPS